jgi:holliday junction DNA helicase RuvA
MIAYIEGKILEVGYDSKQVYIVVLVSGVGYQVFVPSGGVYDVDSSVCLFTSFQVREDSQNLYGFLAKEQKEMFEDLISVSGVGPKVALSIVSMFPSKKFRNILTKGDYESLSKVKGLGQKGAKKIVLELQGIYVQDEEEISSEVLDELSDALEALGFKGKEREKLLKKAKIFYKENVNAPIEVLLSYVLKN